MHETDTMAAYRVITYSANLTFSADFRRMKIWRRIRLMAPTWGLINIVVLQWTRLLLGWVAVC